MLLLVFEALERKGFREGVHYVVEKQTPTFTEKECADLPEWLRPHKHKVIKFYYDRAGNNYGRSRESLAQKVKEAIEKDEAGAATGWRVQLMSLRQSNITMNDEYIFMRELMTGHNARLPQLQIDALHCRRLKTSLEMARTIVDSKKRIGKDKRSEKSADPQRLLVSTNFSDAFKYMMMRPAWVAIVKRGNAAGLPSGSLGDISVR